MKFAFTHISSGDLLRAEVMSGTNRGMQLYKLMASGENVPNEIVDDILAEAMVRKADSKVYYFVMELFSRIRLMLLSAHVVSCCVCKISN